MMNINCSTCLESFTSGCDISTTPCGHVFHTRCITRWLNQNDNCSQCREACEKRQIIKLYFSESQSAIEENITINDLQQKSLKLEERSQKCERELKAMKWKSEHEKLLLKFDWSKTEWNLKKSINEANQRIKDLEKEVKDQKWLTKTAECFIAAQKTSRAQAEKEKITMISGPQQGTIEYEKMLLVYGFPPFPYPIPPGVDPSMHMHMLTTDPVYKAKYDKDRLDKEKAFKEKIDRDNREKDRKAGICPRGPNPYNFQPFGLPTNVLLPTVPASPQQAAALSAAAAAAAAAQAAKENIDMVSEPRQDTIEYEEMQLTYGFPPFPYPIPPGVDPSMHMYMLNRDPVYKAKYYKDRLDKEKAFKAQIDRDKRDTTLLDSDDSD